MSGILHLYPLLKDPEKTLTAHLALMSAALPASEREADTAHANVTNGPSEQGFLHSVTLRPNTAPQHLALPRCSGLKPPLSLGSHDIVEHMLQQSRIKYVKTLYSVE